jgi:ABC-type sulfate transport system permease component
MTTSLIPGIIVALVLARGRFWGKSLLDGLVHLSLVMPPVVTGYLLLLLLGRRGPLGQFLDDHFAIVFAFRWTGAALAYAVMEPHSSGQLASNGATTRRSVGFCCVPRFPCLFAGSLELV